MFTLPTVVRQRREKAVDVSSLRAEAPVTSRLTTVTATTGSCTSKITFIDGDKGNFLRYRGIPIEELAEEIQFHRDGLSDHLRLIASRSRANYFPDQLADHQFLHEDAEYHFEGFPTGAHPMAILSSMINAASCF